MLNIDCVEPSISAAPLVRLILLYILRKINIPNIATREIGNGNNKEMIKIIPKDIPNHTI